MLNAVGHWRDAAGRGSELLESKIWASKQAHTNHVCKNKGREKPHTILSPPYCVLILIGQKTAPRLLQPSTLRPGDSNWSPQGTDCHLGSSHAGQTLTTERAAAGAAEKHTFCQSLKKFLRKTSLVVHSRCSIFP